MDLGFPFDLWARWGQTGDVPVENADRHFVQQEIPLCTFERSEKRLNGWREPVPLGAFLGPDGKVLMYDNSKVRLWEFVRPSALREPLTPPFPQDGTCADILLWVQAHTGMDCVKVSADPTAPPNSLEGASNIPVTLGLDEAYWLDAATWEATRLVLRK